MEVVSAMPCIMRFFGFEETCQGHTQVHHIREGQGASQRADDMLTVPLCWGHHLGPQGLHGLGRKGFYTRYKLDELDLLARTMELLS